jgi:hypothetical protein
MAQRRTKARRVEPARERRAKRRETVNAPDGWFFSCILTVVLFICSAFMFWSAYDIARAGVPYTFQDKYRIGGGRTVSATHATVWHGAVGGVAMIVALGNLKFMLTGSARPFVSLFGHEPWRGRQRPRVADGKRCPYCGYSREGMAWADLCPECGKNSGM